MRFAIFRTLYIFCPLLLLASCAHVNYYGAFTTLKDKVDYVPNILNSIYFQSPKLTTLRICEYDSKNYIALLYSRSKNSKKNINQDRTLYGSIHVLAQMQPRQMSIDRVKYGKAGKINFAQYLPSENEAEIETSFQLLTLLNSIKKNKNIEVYSQSGDNYKRSFIILYK